MYFFSLLNTHFGNYEKAIDDMTNAIVTLEKEPQKFLSKYKNRYISAQTYLNHMLGQCYVTRACLYAVVKNIANARTDMKKADTFPEIPDTISFLFYKNLDKMEKSPNSISLVIKKKQSFDHIVIINHAIRSYPEVDFKWDENLPDIQDGFNWQFPVQLDEKSPYNIPSLEGVDIPLFLPPTQTPSLPVAPVTPQFEIPVVVH
jgi:hypothetical protein